MPQLRLIWLVWSNTTTLTKNYQFVMN
jgi:hypothetical protein